MLSVFATNPGIAVPKVMRSGFPALMGIADGLANLNTCWMQQVMFIASFKGHALIWTMESWEARIVLLHSAFVLIIVVAAALKKCDDA